MGKVAKNQTGGETGDRIIISVKEARKILGKELSDKLSDEDLAAMIGNMYRMAEAILNSTPADSASVLEKV